MLCWKPPKEIQYNTAPVHLNVYDLSSINGYAYWLGLGVYHSGVEVHGVEYGFGAHEDPETGIFEVEPRQCNGWAVRRSILIGRTQKGTGEVREVMEALGLKYRGDAYNLITKNCNHFCHDACLALCGKPIPRWVNRLARIGVFCNCVAPANLNKTRVTIEEMEEEVEAADKKRVMSRSNRFSDFSSLSSDSFHYRGHIPTLIDSD